jgi:hypothetical protein
MNTRLVQLGSALAALASLVLAACGGGGGGSNPPAAPGAVRVSGAVSATSSAALFQVAASSALAVPAANAVIAIPLQHGSLSGSSMSSSQTAPLGADGAFTLRLDKSSDWLLVLANTGVVGAGRFLGSVDVRTDVGAGLLELPFTTAAIDVLALGTVTHTAAWDATSATTVDATAFRLSDSQLVAVAKSDDIFRNAMNIVNNFGTYAGAGVWYALRPDFQWWDAASVLSTDYSDPARLAADYRGMSFQIDSNQTEVGIDALCAHSAIVTFEPPGLVTVDGVGYVGSAVPMTSANVVCETLVTNEGTSRRGWSGPLYMSGGYGASPSLSVKTVTENPVGSWILKVNGTVRAAFDVAGVNPPVTAGDAPKGFVPAFKINTQPDGRITSVDVKWYYDDGGTYVPLAPTDLAVLRFFIERLELDFSSVVGGTTLSEDVYIDPSVETRAVPTRYAWYYGGTPPTPGQATGLMGFYESGGFGHFFHFPPR